MVGVLTVVAGVLAAGVASGASAALPELGRCIKLTKVSGKYTGQYRSANCVAVSPAHSGPYEWAPGPGPKNKFSAVAAAEPEPLLETVGGAKVSCATLAITGEYTGPKSFKASKIVLTGCGQGARPCQTVPTHTQEIESSGEVEGELGSITGGERPVAGWDLKRSGGGPLFAFTCGRFPEIANTQTIEGSVIGAISAGRESNVNRMYIKSLFKFKQQNGSQLPEKFEGAPQDVLSTTTLTGTAKTVEQTGLAATVLATSGLGSPTEEAKNQEPLEIKTK